MKTMKLALIASILVTTVRSWGYFTCVKDTTNPGNCFTHTSSALMTLNSACSCNFDFADLKAFVNSKYSSIGSNWTCSANSTISEATFNVTSACNNSTSGFFQSTFANGTNNPVELSSGYWGIECTPSTYETDCGYSGNGYSSCVGAVDGSYYCVIPLSSSFYDRARAECNNSFIGKSYSTNTIEFYWYYANLYPFQVNENVNSAYDISCYNKTLADLNVYRTLDHSVNSAVPLIISIVGFYLFLT